MKVQTVYCMHFKHLCRNGVVIKFCDMLSQQLISMMHDITAFISLIDIIMYCPRLKYGNLIWSISIFVASHFIFWKFLDWWSSILYGVFYLQELHFFLSGFCLLLYFMRFVHLFIPSFSFFVGTTIQCVDYLWLPTLRNHRLRWV